MKLTKLFTALFAMIILASCVNDDDFQVPDLEVMEPELDGEVITIAALRNQFLQEEETIDFSESTLYVEGYVISSDESGNWFEEIILQDKPENPTAGVRLLIDESPLFTYYEFGRKVFIKLGGLHAGDSNGVLSLGVGENLQKIPAPLQFEYIIRSPEVAEIIPTETTISGFSEDLENTFIQLTDVQFVKEEVIDQTLTYAGEPLDEFDGERTLTSCDDNQTVILSTSTFADFKSTALPAGRGSVTGVLTRNFFGDTFNIAINDLSNVNLDNNERCDPVELDCGLADDAGDSVLFEDDFEGQNTNQPISGNGWTNYIQEGTETWEAYSQSGGSVSIGISARIGSFNSGDDSSIAWLVTPEIEITDNDNVTLEFLTSNSFSDGSNLELLFSSDWDGTPENIPSATWDSLSAANIVGDDDDFVAFFESGIVDLSCIESDGYIAFKYTGSGDPDFDGTFELEGVQVNAD